MKKRFFYRLVISLLFITIVPLLTISYFNYKNSSNLLISEINATNTLLLNKIMENIDMNLASIKKALLSFVLVNQDELVSLSNDIKFTGAEFYSSSKFLPKMNDYKMKHEYIDDMVLIFKKQPFIITCNGSFYYDYYTNEFGNKGMVKLLDSKKNGSIDFIESYNISKYAPNPVSFDALTYSYTFPFFENKPAILLTAVINKQKLVKSIKDVGLTKNGVVVITDSSGNIISLYSNMLFDNSRITSLTREVFNIPERHVIKFDKTYYAVTKVYSQFNGWNYISFIPSYEIISKVSSLKGFAVSLLGIFVFIALLFTLATSKYLYEPLRRILSIFNVQTKSEFNDEFNFLRANITNILIENKDLQEKFLNALPSLQENFVKELTYNDRDESQLEDKAKKLGIIFPHRLFRVVLLKFKQDTNIENSTGIEGIRMLIKKLFHHYYMLTNDNNIIIIFNYNMFNVNIIADIFSSYRIALCLGNEYDSIGDLHKSYMEASICVEYSTLLPQFELIEYCKLPSENTSRLMYSSEFERHFINCIEAKRYEESLKKANEVIMTYIDADIQICYLLINMDNLYNILRRVCTRLKIDNEAVLGNESDYSDLKLTFNNVEQFRMYFIEIYNNFVNYVSNKGYPGKELCNKPPVVQNIEQYIKNNLASEITLETLAEKFNISYNYLSTMFKEYTNQGFVEYITRLRIEKAKELLKNFSFKIKEIAGMVGYQNVLTFTRNFKKYEDMSPSDYQSILSGSEDEKSFLYYSG